MGSGACVHGVSLPLANHSGANKDVTSTSGLAPALCVAVSWERLSEPAVNLVNLELLLGLQVT
jgi:hypothetical protein